MNAELVLTVFSIAVGVLALGSAVVIGLRGNALKADIAQLRGSNADLDAELVRKDRRLHDLELDYAALKEDSSRKDAALARIGEQAASGVELQAVADALREASGLARDHDREAAARHASTIRTLKEVMSALTELRTAIERRKP